ncbi:unnamed protein product, partial [marine sediment metagenome]
MTFENNNFNHNLELATAEDTIYPIFSNHIKSPTTNTQYGPDRIYNFNVTILNSNGSAGIDFNGVNYTFTNISDVFNSSVVDLGVDTYTYYWWAYGNGVDNNYNISTSQNYIVKINSSTKTTLGYDTASPITYPRLLNVTCGDNIPNQVSVLTATNPGKAEEFYTNDFFYTNGC